MERPPVDLDETFLTERQAEVLARRNDGLTQRAIADDIGTSVANVSAVEGAARRNVARARRTLTLARLLGAAVRLRAEAGTDLREVVDRVYGAGDEAGVRIAYTDPELATHLHAHLADRLEDRRLTDDAAVGVLEDGEVVTHPSAEVPDLPDGG